nr:scavenger receptor cysteine-rich domain superfamily protein-like [Lytechinus pictus]
MATGDESGTVILLGKGRTNEGAVLVRNSVRDEFKFLPSEGWTFKNSKVACRQLGFMHGFIRPFNMSVHLDDRNLPPVRRQLYDCEGSESTLEQCARRDFNSSFTPSVAGVLCSDDGGTLSQFLILNGDNKILRIAKNVDNPQWLIICTQRYSHLAHLACQQTGRLFALRDGLDQPPGNILLAVENEPCTDPVIQACNVTTHLVEHANCSDYGVIPVSCSDKMGKK